MRESPDPFDTTEDEEDKDSEIPYVSRRWLQFWNKKKSVDEKYERKMNRIDKERYELYMGRRDIDKKLRDVHLWRENGEGGEVSDSELEKLEDEERRVLCGLDMTVLERRKFERWMEQCRDAGAPGFERW